MVFCRRFTLLVVALLAALQFMAAAAQMDEGDNARTIQLAQSIDPPIYDIHFHPMPFMSPD